MYRIYANDNIIHAPHLFDDGYVVLSPSVTQAPNTHGSMRFTMPPGHPCYDEMEPLNTIVRVLDDSEELFRGRIIEVTRDFYNRKEIYCEGEMAFLCDSYYRPFGFQGSPAQLFTALIQNHNEQVDEERQFTLGDITVEDSNDYINRSSESALSTWEAIKNCLIDSLGGYVRIRLEGGVRYIDYIANLDGTSDQIIRFGENLLNIEDYVSAADIITCLIPYGATYDEEDAGYTEQPENDSYNGNRVDICSVNDGKDYVYSETGVALYGCIWGTNVWDDVTEPANLLKKAQSYVDAAILEHTTLTIKAVDLHLIDVDTGRIHAGDYVRVYSKPHNISVYLCCTELRLDLANPENTEITLGVSSATLTEGVSAGSLSGGNSTQSGADLSALTARVVAIERDYVTHDETTNLVANSVTVQELIANVADISSLLAGAAGVEALQAIHLTADNVVIDDAVITDAMIKNLTASKLTAGTIYTNVVTIQSGEDDKSLFITNSVIAMYDEDDNQRLQAGCSNDDEGYNFVIWGIDDAGKPYEQFNATGVTASGIPKETIVNDHIAENAGISGSKLNIADVAEKLNEDGSVTVNYANVVIDNDSFSAVYGQLTGSDEEGTHSLKSALDIVAGQITSKVWQSDIDSATNSISDKYSTLSLTVDGIDSRVGVLETSADSLLSKYSDISQKVDSIALTVTSSADGTASIQLVAGDEAVGDALTAVTSARTAFAKENTAIVISAGTVAFKSNTLIVDSSQFTLDSSGNATFKGTLSAATGTFSGSLSAATGSFSGSVTATSGTLGGWTIEDGYLYSGSSSSYVRLNTSTSSYSSYAIWAGAAAASSAPFSVTKAGALYAKNAVLSGSIYLYDAVNKTTFEAINGSAGGVNLPCYCYINDSLTVEGQLVVYDSVCLEGSVYGLTLVNNKPIYFNNKSGSAVQVLNMSTSNNLNIGYGLYSAATGNTNIYGTDVSIYSATASSHYRPYLRAGDSISLGTFYTAGYVTNSKTEVCFSIPLNRPIIGSPTVSIEIGNLRLRQDGAYTHGCSSSTYADVDSVSVSSANYIGVRVVATFSTTTNAVNNAPIGITCSGAILKFS